MTDEELSEMLAEHAGEICGGMIDTSKFYIDVNPPKLTGYLHIGDGLTFTFYEKLPNRFHRFMQWLFFGFRWEKVSK